MPRLPALWVLPALAFPGFAQQEAGEFFELRVRPLLAANCYACHSQTATAGLRLDSAAGVAKGGNSGPAIVPGNPEASLLFQAVAHTHERLKMPPSARLPESDVAALRKWIAAGARWPEEKAEQRAGGRRIKPEDRAYWAFQPLRKPAAGGIDALVRAQLAAKGLKPARPADAWTLLRRVTFDLTGLPPSYEEVRSFEQDHSADAYARAVDKLLNSPRFGERWGRHWLDVARYAEDDIRGLSQEKYPNAWRYRDWVIGAFNRDMPFDIFVKAQIAGDLLRDERYSDLTAGTGFFGLGPWYYDIALPPQARADERHDRVDALTRGFLGLTAACARCHDHKFDPITMRDYYGLAGVFSSSEYREYPLVPEETARAYQEHQQRIKDQEKAVREYSDAMTDRLAQMLARKTGKYMLAAWSADPADAAGLDTETVVRFRKYLAQKEREHPFGKDWDRLKTREDTMRAAAELQKQLFAAAAAKKEIDDENLPLLAPVNQKKARKTALPNGYVSFEDFCTGCQLAVKALDRDRYMLWNDFFGRGRRKDKDGGGAAVFVYEGKDLDRWLSGEWKDHLEGLRAELEELKRTAPKPYPLLHGLGESAAPANLRIHLRGSPYNLGEETPRRFVEVLSGREPAPITGGSGRLELASAIAGHPLAARVMVNRVWGHLFGEALARTPGNFGQLGMRPAQPELLDYLTFRFVENGYSVKKLIREIVLSGTYGLSSAPAEPNQAADPGNLLIWRANRRRLDAEALRDALLFVAGSLDEKLGGESIDLDQDRSRRTVYGRISRFRLNPTLALFDFPSPDLTSEKRNVTHVPLQRLFYLNADLVMSQSRKLAGALAMEPTPEERVRRAYRLIFARDASEEEAALGSRFLRETPGEDALAQLAHALVSSNEFSFLD